MKGIGWSVIAVGALVASACGDGGPLQDPVGTTSTTTSTVEIASTTTSLPVTGEPSDRVVAGIDFGTLGLPTAASYDEYVLLVDDTETIEMEVPTDWSDVGTRPSEADPPDPELEPWPSIRAATDLEDFISGGWASSDAMSNTLDATSEQDELDALDERIDLSSTCDSVTAVDYDDGSYTGLAELWTDCASTGAAQLAISTFVESDHLLVVVTLMTTADIEAATRIIETYSFTGA